MGKKSRLDRIWGNPDELRPCHYCGELLSNDDWNATVDHLIPTVRGGADVPSNWAICCGRCNTLKGPLTEAEFRSVMGDRKKRKRLMAEIGACIEAERAERKRQQEERLLDADWVVRS